VTFRRRDMLGIFCSYIAVALRREILPVVERAKARIPVADAIDTRRKIHFLPTACFGGCMHAI